MALNFAHRTVGVTLFGKQCKLNEVWLPLFRPVDVNFVFLTLTSIPLIIYNFVLQLKIYVFLLSYDLTLKFLSTYINYGKFLPLMVLYVKCCAAAWVLIGVFLSWCYWPKILAYFCRVRQNIRIVKFSVKGMKIRYNAHSSIRLANWACIDVALLFKINHELTSWNLAHLMRDTVCRLNNGINWNFLPEFLFSLSYQPASFHLNILFFKFLQVC